MLLPAYSHGSEVEALVRAGLEPRWYEGTPALEPDEDELERLLGPATRALHLTHYLGFPQDAPRWRRLRVRDVLLEDAAQAWLADLRGAAGVVRPPLDLLPLQSVGVPDGAALLVGGEPGAPRAEAPLGADVAARKAAVWLTGGSTTAASLLARAPRGRGGDDTALGDGASPASRATAYLLPRLTGPEVAAARRANYEALLEELGDEVAAPFGTLPAGAAPFCFPVETGDRPRTRTARRRRRLGARPLVGAPPGLRASEFPAIQRRRERTVGLPVHQRSSARKGWSRCCRRFGGPLDGVPSRASAPPPAWRAPGGMGGTRGADPERLRDPDCAELRWRPFGAGKELLLGSLRGADGALAAPCSRSTSGRSVRAGSRGSWGTTVATSSAR